jgi:hypothetical protein
MTRLLG